MNSCDVAKWCFRTALIVSVACFGIACGEPDEENGDAGNGQEDRLPIHKAIYVLDVHGHQLCNYDDGYLEWCADAPEMDEITDQILGGGLANDGTYYFVTAHYTDEDVHQSVEGLQLCAVDDSGERQWCEDVDLNAPHLTFEIDVGEDGSVFFTYAEGDASGDHDNPVCRYTDGQEDWCVTLEGKPRDLAAGPDGGVYVLSDDTGLCHFDASGEQQWCEVYGDDSISIVSVGDNGSVYGAIETGNQDEPMQICGFDGGDRSGCFDAPEGADVFSLLGDQDGNLHVGYNEAPEAGNPCKYDSSGERDWCAAGHQYSEEAVLLTDLADDGSLLAMLHSVTQQFGPDGQAHESFSLVGMASIIEYAE